MLLNCKNSVWIYELFNNYFIELIHLENPKLLLDGDFQDSQHQGSMQA